MPKAVGGLAPLQVPLLQSAPCVQEAPAVPGLQSDLAGPSPFTQ